MPAAASPHKASADRQVWLERFCAVRDQTLALTASLSPEDQQIQSMPDVSPTKWHLAHTTWFFETFLLSDFAPRYRPFDARYAYLFNSYYEAVGERWPRAQRGLLSRPGLADVHAYRRHVDAAMTALILEVRPDAWRKALDLLELGLHHEQQHQELILMDIQHVLSLNPLAPAYGPPGQTPTPCPPLTWTAIDGGLVEIGHAGAGFAFDNEGPRHKTWLEPFLIADRPSSAGEFLAFIGDGGYRRPELWLSEGWAGVQREGWTAPLYWRAPEDDGEATWRLFAPGGLVPLNPDAPVRHLSHFEADAFARWAGRRLPTEAEWEIAATRGLRATGQVWEWTMSPYAAYPGYRPAAGAVGEYNGKFMSGQMVLRGGCAATPKGHMRLTYRNFFPPTARWAFSGVRLADDA